MKTVKVDENCIQMHHQKGQRCHRFSMSSLPILLLDAPLPMMRFGRAESNHFLWAQMPADGDVHQKAHWNTKAIEKTTVQHPEMSVCLYVCTYVRTCLCMSMYVYVYVYVCLCLCLCLCMSMPMSMYVYVYVCLCLCLCLCLCMSMYVYVYIYIYLYLCV